MHGNSRIGPAMTPRTGQVYTDGMQRWQVLQVTDTHVRVRHEDRSAAEFTLDLSRFWTFCALNGLAPVSAPRRPG